MTFDVRTLYRGRQARAQVDECSERHGRRTDRMSRGRRRRRRLDGDARDRRTSPRSTRSRRRSRSGPCSRSPSILGGVSRPDIGAGWNAALAVLLAGLGVLAIAYTISLYARKYAGAGAVYEYLTHGAHPWVGVFTAGFFFVGALFLGGGGIYLGLGILIDGFWTTHISRQRARLVGLGDDRARDRPRPQLLRRAARDPRDARRSPRSRSSRC